MHTARLNLYKTIHKGLRLGHCQLLGRLGAVDWQDQKAAASLLDDLRGHLGLCREHLDHEDASVHPRLAEVAPDVLAALEHDHAEHLAGLGSLHALIAMTADVADEDRPAFGYRLYLAFTQFMAEDFRHMEREEAEAMPVLWHHLSDADLMDIHIRIVTAIAPSRMIDYMRLMLPAIEQPERLTMLRGMKDSAPEPAFKAVLELAARPSLQAEDWQRLATSLGVAA